MALLRAIACEAWREAFLWAFALAFASDDCDAEGGARGAMARGLAWPSALYASVRPAVDRERVEAIDRLRENTRRGTVTRDGT